MNKIEIYLSTILSNCIGFFFNFVFFVLFFEFIDRGAAGLGWQAFYFIPLFLNLVLLALAFSIILSTIYIVAKDINQVWIVVTGIGFWLSPVVFNPETFRKALPHADYISPIAGLIINSRNVLFYRKQPEWNLFIFDMVYAVVLLLIGLLFLNKLGSRAAEKL